MYGRNTLAFGDCSRAIVLKVKSIVTVYGVVGCSCYCDVVSDLRYDVRTPCPTPMYTGSPTLLKLLKAYNGPVK